jgi:hypothetical protein
MICLAQLAENVMGRWTSLHPADIGWRREQISVNNDFAGLATCPRADQFAAELEARHLSPADRRDVLSYFIGRAQEWSEQRPSAPKL